MKVMTGRNICERMEGLYPDYAKCKDYPMIFAMLSYLIPTDCEAVTQSVIDGIGVKGFKEWLIETLDCCVCVDENVRIEFLALKHEYNKYYEQYVKYRKLQGNLIDSSGEPIGIDTDNLEFMSGDSLDFKRFKDKFKRRVIGPSIGNGMFEIITEAYEQLKQERPEFILQLVSSSYYLYNQSKENMERVRNAYNNFLTSYAVGNKLSITNLILLEGKIVKVIKNIDEIDVFTEI